MSFNSTMIIIIIIIIQLIIINDKEAFVLSRVRA
jgi:hypothetical protein